MRIAFFGSSLVSSYWNGAATYYRGLLRALAAHGHRIAFYEPDAFDRQAYRDIADPDWVEAVVVYPADLAGAEAALRQAQDADVVVKASGVGVLDEALEEAVLELRRSWRSVLYWDVDAPATLERIAASPRDPFRRLVPEYDAILTYGGGEPVVDGYRALGARICAPIYNAVDPDTHHPVSPAERFRGDLGFLGNRLPDREARVDAFFFEPARRLPRRRFLLGGSGWTGHGMPANVRGLGHVPTAEHNAFNCSPSCVLNVTRDSMARCGYSPATRVFEAAGAGACLITDEWPGIERFLEPDREVLVARDGEDVAAHLEALSPERAARIGAAARARVLSEHTYAVRAAEVEALLAGNFTAVESAA